MSIIFEAIYTQGAIKANGEKAFELAHIAVPDDNVSRTTRELAGLHNQVARMLGLNNPQPH